MYLRHEIVFPLRSVHIWCSRIAELGVDVQMGSHLELIENMCRLDHPPANFQRVV